MRRTYRSADRGQSQQTVQWQNVPRQQDGQRQQSFYRGPESGQLDSRQGDSRDRSRGEFEQSQRQREAISNRDGRQQFDGRARDGENRGERDFAERSNRDGDRRGDDWRNRVFDDQRNVDRNRFTYRRDDFRRDDWRQTANRVRDDWRGRDRDRLPFRYGWWDNRGANWPVYSPWRYSWWQDRPYYWWGWTPANRLTNWLVFGWNRPYYWDYGPGGNIYYQDDYVYYDRQRYLPANEYYQQVYDLAHSVPRIDQSEAERMDWAPLGVFAAIRGNDQGERTIQLAVNKNGVISGTYFNAQSEKVHPLSGMVDDRTQRAAFAFADGEQEDVVFETSIYNLTESESSLMVHFGPRSSETEIWRLVRIERPEAQEAELPSPRTESRREL